MTELSPNLLDLIRCPVSGDSLRVEDGVLVSGSGRKYPIVQGVPVLFVEEDLPLFPVAAKTWERAWEVARAGSFRERYFVETVGISESERRQLELSIRGGKAGVDPVVSWLIAATGGRAFSKRVGRLTTYPIPEFPGDRGAKGRLLDVGCGWGRWSFAAERANWSTIGIDPSLGAVLAARRVAAQIGSTSEFVVGDGRYLPFRQGCFERAFSFSVVQHFSDDDLSRVVAGLARVLATESKALIQLAGARGPLAILNQIRRGFRKAREFEVRYRSASRIEEMLAPLGRVRVEVDSFIGLGLQPSDRENLGPLAKAVAVGSDRIRRLFGGGRCASWFADSLWAHVARGSESTRSGQLGVGDPREVATSAKGEANLSILREVIKR